MVTRKSQMNVPENIYKGSDILPIITTMTTTMMIAIRPPFGILIDPRSAPDEPVDPYEPASPRLPGTTPS